MHDHIARLCFESLKLYARSTAIHVDKRKRSLRGRGLDSRALLYIGPCRAVRRVPLFTV